ncbi:MAG TPA: hypothetical protein VMD99_17660 [Terriglobales bacterium]|nr:hypothetical protein [Terriglobales bacterium]
MPIEGDISLDISSPLLDTAGVAKATLIADLKEKVNFYQEQVERNQKQLRVWLAALKSAQGEDGNEKPKRAIPSLPTKGKAGRKFIREILASHADIGMTPKEIRQAAEQRQLEVTTNYPYAALHKMRTVSKEVREVEGRYFLVKGE